MKFPFIDSGKTIKLDLFFSSYINILYTYIGILIVIIKYTKSSHSAI